MAWVFTAARRITKRRHNEEAQAVLDRLAAYLRDNETEPVEMLCGFWRDQQDAITYQEMRELVLQGYVDEVTARLWQQDYSELVKNRMPRIWNGAMVQGVANTPLLSSLANYTFNMNTPGVLRWIQSRGAEMVTVSTQRQKDAIALLLEDKMRNAHTVDELARLIRPCVGLYRQQAAAVKNYYENMVKTLTEQHPRTKPERIQLKALDRATKYAERLHRQRALMIAQTEMAFAYNYGANEGIRQAQENFLIGKCEKVWCTSGDAQVCDKCAALDGKRVGMEERFYDGNTRYEESGLYPPLHPRCACAVQYVEVEAPPVRRLDPESHRVEPPTEAQQSTPAIQATEESADTPFVTKLCDLDPSKISSVYPNIPTTDVVLTSERIEHIRDHHPDDYALFQLYANAVIQDPDIILDDSKNPETVMYIRSVESTNLNIIIRLSLASDSEKNHSVMTAYRLGAKTIKRLQKKNKTLYFRP